MTDYAFVAINGYIYKASAPAYPSDSRLSSASPEYIASLPGPQVINHFYSSIINNPEIITGPSLAPRFECVVSIEDFHGLCDGVTDDTAALNRALAFLNSEGGGTVTFPGRRCLILGCIQPPYDGTNTPIQKPFRLIGAGCSPDSYLGNSIAPGGNRAPIGGTILDLRYAGGVAKQVAKIDTRGGGYFEIAHMTIMDGSTSNYQFLRTTNTTLNIHDVVFTGNTANSGRTCVQDAIQLGGDITTNARILDTDADNSGFQGYGTTIGPNVFFSNVRHCVAIGSAGNSIQITGCTVSFSCGSGSAIDAPFVVYGNGYQTWGNVFKSNTVEIRNYEYGYVLKTLAGGGGSNYNYIETGTWDEDPVLTLGVVYFEAGSIYNTVMMTATDTGMELLLAMGPGAAQNTVIGMSRTSTFAALKTWSTNPNVFAGPISVAAGGAAQSKTVDVGNGLGQKVVYINGGATNAADGAALYFGGAGSIRASIGHYSAYFGGAYSTDMIFVSAAKVGMGTLGGGYLISGTGSNLVVGAAAGGVGFYGGAGGTKPTVTGAKAGNVALASLLTALSGLGLITDSTT